jgi:PleD family two-component response regulator
VLAALRTPVPLGDRSVVVGASIGIALAHQELDGDALLRQADAAMYAAKTGGKNTASLYGMAAPA